MSVYWRDYKQEKAGPKTGAGSWAYKFKYNKVIYRAAGFRTKREAEDVEAEAKVAARKGVKPIPRSKSLGFTDVMQEFLQSRELIRSQNTLDGEKSKAARLLDHFGNQSLRNIDTAKIEQYRDRRIREGLKPRTINLQLVLLRCFFNFAIDHNYARFNPAKAVKDLKVPQEEKIIPTDDEFYRILDEAGKKPYGKPVVVWIKLLALTGMRLSESLYLEWRDISFADQVIKVRPKDGNPLKTGKWRPVPIHSELLPVLKEWKTEWERVFAEKVGPNGKPPHDWVFFRPRKPEERCISFRQSFENACEAAGLEGITIHSLRHYFISKMVQSGLEPAVIAKMVGHSSTVMIYQVYMHLSPAWKQSQIERASFGLPVAQRLEQGTTTSVKKSA